MSFREDLEANHVTPETMEWLWNHCGARRRAGADGPIEEVAQRFIQEMLKSEIGAIGLATALITVWEASKIPCVCPHCKKSFTPHFEVREKKDEMPLSLASG